MQKTFTVYADPSHAWAKVPLAVLTAIGLTAGDFSQYSYANGGCLYLEEDCDLGIFAKAFEEKTGAAPQWSEQFCNGRSRIRSYPSNVSGAGYAARREKMFG